MKPITEEQKLAEHIYFYLGLSRCEYEKRNYSIEDVERAILAYHIPEGYKPITVREMGEILKDRVCHP